MRRAAAILALLAFVANASPASGHGAERAWAEASGSVLAVEPTWPGYNKPGFGAPKGTAPEGSGVAVMEPGLVLTAAHVVSKASEVHVRLADESRVKAEVLAVDGTTDLALLRIPAETKPIAIAEERPITGAPVCAIGNAFGLGVSIACGIVSAARRSGVGFNPVEDFLQTDAAVNPGSSGGALVDMEGRLVGMLSAIFTMQTDANIGVNFAVSADLLQARLKEMLAAARP